jgi:zinc/manganese transport system permease protein
MNFHDLFVEPFTFEFMRRGLLSAVLLSLSGGLLGCILVLRRLALMGDALSHSLLPGVALAYAFFGPSTLALFVGALLAGLLTATGSALLSRLTRVKEDAAFGSLFIIFFALGVAVVSTLRSRIDLMHFLFGNILGVSGADLQLAGLVSATTLAVFVVFYRPILLETFDPIFLRATGGRGGLVHVGILCLTVLNLIAALQAMGIVLSLGLFLLPAVTAYLWCDRLSRMLLLSVILALAGSALGILASYHLGLASGASIVLSLGVFFLFSAAFSPRYGVGALVLQKLRAGKGVLHDAGRP